MGLANPNPIPNPNPEQVRACRYDSTNEGVYGSGVLCEAHNDVGPDKEPLGMVVVRGNSVQAMEALEHIPQAKRGP